MRERKKKQRFFFDSLLSFLSPLLYPRPLFSPSIPTMMKAVSRVSAQVRRIRPRNARPRQENEGCPLLSIATPFSQRSVFSFQPRSTATPSSFLFFPAPPPKLTCFLHPPFRQSRNTTGRRTDAGVEEGLQGLSCHPCCDSRGSADADSPLGACVDALARRRRRGRCYAACRARGRERCVLIWRERESTRGYRNWNRRRGEGQKKGGNSFFRRCLDEKKNLLLLKPLFLSLFSLSPPPPDNNKQASSPPSRTPRTATSSRTPLAGRRSREF